MPNLVSVVMQFLTPDMIAKIGSALGLDRNVAQKAIGGAVPALYPVWPMRPRRLAE